MKKIPEISAAQEEVWEWKEKASEKLNQLSGEQRIAYLKDKEVAFLKQLKALQSKKPETPSR